MVADADNLVCRAARAFQAAVGLDACVRFHLIKRIPAGGGLGGGSSDAAAALRLLDHLAGNPVGIPGLTSLASSLGADVPFFLQAGTQRGRGVGDDLSPLPGVPGWRFVLILPPVGTATPEVYQNLAAHLIARSTADSIGRGPEVPEFSKLALPMGFRNDLEASALQLYPELAELRRDLVGLGFPHASLSGSGSTFFVALPDAEQCGDAMTRLQPLRARHGVTLLETGSGLAAPGEPRLVPFSGA